MTVTIDQRDWQKVLAEVVGTFFFFFVGIGSSDPNWCSRTSD